MLENHSYIFRTNLLIAIKVVPIERVTIYTKYLHIKHQSELRIKTATGNLHTAVNETLLAHGAVIVAHEAVEPLSHDAWKTQVLQHCSLGNFRVGAQLFIQLVEVFTRLLLVLTFMQLVHLLILRKFHSCFIDALSSAYSLAEILHLLQIGP